MTDTGGVDTSVPHSARIWNYWLGGPHHFAVDREAGDAWAAVHPEIALFAREGRAFQRRAVRYLAEAGIRQFLDVGAGLPAAENTHEIARAVAPDARVVYVDSDPFALDRGRAMLAGDPAARYVSADLHDVGAVADGAAQVLDLGQPVAVLFMGVLGHVDTIEQARGIVRGLLDRVPAGSHLSAWDGTIPSDGPAREHTLAAEQEYADTGAVRYRYREADEVASLFDGLEWVEPGFVTITRWRPDGSGHPDPIDEYGGVARKP